MELRGLTVESVGKDWKLKVLHEYSNWEDHVHLCGASASSCVS